MSPITVEEAVSGLAEEPVDEHKLWAVGLDQFQFQMEWMRRFPRADVVPDVKEWLKVREIKRESARPILPEEYEDDKQVNLEKEAKEKQEARNKELAEDLKCKYCGKVCKARIGKVKHEAYCKMGQNARD